MTLEPFAVARERAMRIRPTHLLLGAACLHLLVAIAIYVGARLAILPALFTSEGTGQFVFDSLRYQQQAKALAGLLASDGISAWLRAPAEFHVQLYSLSFTIFSPLFGYSVLAV